MPVPDLPTWAGDVAALLAELQEVKAALDALFGRISFVDLTGAGPHGITVDHYGKQLLVTKGSTGVATLLLPASALVGSTFLARGLDCTLAIATAAGASFESWQGHGGSAAVKAPIFMTCRANPDGQSAVWMLEGCTA